MTSAFVADVDPDAGELTARFEGRDLVYGFGELDTLVLPMPRRSTRARARNIRPW